MIQSKDDDGAETSQCSCHTLSCPTETRIERNRGPGAEAPVTRPDAPVTGYVTSRLSVFASVPLVSSSSSPAAMADAPIKFKRSRTKQATTRNRDSPAPNDESSSNVGESADNSPSPAAVAAKLKSKVKQRGKPKTALSFGGDDEEVRLLIPLLSSC